MGAHEAPVDVDVAGVLVLLVEDVVVAADDEVTSYVLGAGRDAEVPQVERLRAPDAPVQPTCNARIRLC